MKSVTLVEETRAGVVENVHTGMICGVNEKFEIVYHAGDVEHVTYYRSASKPIQALPIFLTDCISKYGLTVKKRRYLRHHNVGKCIILLLLSRC